MNVKVKKDMRGGTYFVRFLLENFTDDEIYYISRYGPFKLLLPEAAHRWRDKAVTPSKLLTSIDELHSYEFYFKSYEQAVGFSEQVLALIKRELDSFISKADTFVGEEVFEVKAGEEIKKINEGAKKILDKKSKEYKEIVEKNREAWKMLSEL